MKTVKNGNLLRVYDGDILVEAWSYHTCIFARLDGFAVFNATKYEVITTRHQNVIRKEILENEEFVIVIGIPEGADAEYLREAVKGGVKWTKRLEK